MKTKIRFYWPKDYRNGKKSFDEIPHNASPDVLCIPGTLMSEAFAQTHIGRIIMEMNPEINHVYWKDIRNQKVIRVVPNDPYSLIHAFANPAIDVFIDNPREIGPKTFHLKYFSIPTYLKIKLNIYEEYNETYDIPEGISGTDKLFESNLNLDDRKIVSI